MPELLHRAGVEAMVIGRFHEHLKQKMRKEQALRWQWIPPYFEVGKKLIGGKSKAGYERQIQILGPSSFKASPRLVNSTFFSKRFILPESAENFLQNSCHGI